MKSIALRGPRNTLREIDAHRARLRRPVGHRFDVASSGEHASGATKRVSLPDRNATATREAA
jgi:hypothetical protein